MDLVELGEEGPFDDRPDRFTVRSDPPRVTSLFFDAPRHVVFVGQSDGSLVAWDRREVVDVERVKGLGGEGVASSSKGKDRSHGGEAAAPPSTGGGDADDGEGSDADEDAAGDDGSDLRFVRRSKVMSCAVYPHAHHGEVTCMTLVPAGRIPHATAHAPALLFTGSADRTVKVWDPHRPAKSVPAGEDPTLNVNLRRRVQTIEGHDGVVTGMTHVGVGTADGAIDYALVTASRDGKVRVWSRMRGRENLRYPWYECTFVVPDLDDWVTCLHWSEHGHLPRESELYIGDASGRVHCYGIGFGAARDSREAWKAVGARSMTFTRRTRRSAHAVGVAQVMHARRRNIVISIGGDGNAVVVDQTTGSEVFRVCNHEGRKFTAFEWFDEQGELVLGDSSGTLYVYDIFADQCVLSRRPPGGAVSRLALFEGGTRLLAAGQFGVRWLRVHRKRTYAEYTGHAGAIVGLHFRDGGATDEVDWRLYTASADNTIRSWNPVGGVVDRVWSAFEAEVSAFHFLRDRGDFATGHGDGGILLWSHDAGTAVVMEGHGNTVTSLGFARDRHHAFLLSGDYNGVVGVWDLHRVHAPTLFSMFRAHDEEILCLACDPHARVLFTAGNGRSIRAWSIDRMVLVDEYAGHTAPVNCMAMDGAYLFSGSADGCIRVWDTFSGAAIGAVYPGVTKWVPASAATTIDAAPNDGHRNGKRGGAGKGSRRRRDRQQQRKAKGRLHIPAHLRTVAGRVEGEDDDDDDDDDDGDDDDNVDGVDNDCEGDDEGAAGGGESVEAARGDADNNDAAKHGNNNGDAGGGGGNIPARAGRGESSRTWIAASDPLGEGSVYPDPDLPFDGGGAAVTVLEMIPSLGLVASGTSAGRIDIWDYGTMLPVFSHVINECVTALAWRQRERELIVGCASGRVLAFPIPHSVRCSAHRELGIADDGPASDIPGRKTRDETAAGVDKPHHDLGNGTELYATFENRASAEAKRRQGNNQGVGGQALSQPHPPTMPPPHQRAAAVESPTGSDDSADEILSTLKRLSIVKPGQEKSAVPGSRFRRHAAATQPK